MEARLRVDNHTNERAIVDTGEIELVALDLTSFPPPLISPAAGLEVPPEGSGIVMARFPYPPGEGARTEGLRAVDLRWIVAVGGRRFSNGLTFHCVVRQPSLSDPWFWEPEPNVVLRGESGRSTHR
jgi:hypothetical protein